MEHGKNLEGNLQHLFEKLDGLQGTAQLIAARGKPKMKYWLCMFERCEQDAHEIQEKLRGSTNKDRRKLNTKVRSRLQVVIDLEEKNILKGESTEELLKELEINQVKQFTPDELEYLTQNYSTLIGQGECGSVYKGHFTDSFPIAVKVIEDKGITLEEEILMAAVRTMNKTSHRNLVKFYGFCFGVEKKALVFEYMERGSLDNYLYHPSTERIIDWGKLYEIAVGIAWGLHYLHEGLQDRIIHGNLKPSNVLLDSHLYPKLTDFALRKLMNRDLSPVISTGNRVVPGLAAPEMSDPESRVTYKSDVYSFGKMLFQILGWKKNLPEGECFSHQVKAMVNNFEMDQLLNDCCIYEKKDRENAKILSIVALQCTQKEAESRPTMISVAMMLEDQIKVTMFET